MRIIDLDEANVPSYLVCLEDWSEEMREAGDHKAQWYSRMKEKGLRVKLALSDDDTAGGMIQYGPLDISFAEGDNLYFIFCIWVHGYKKGRGDFRGRGMGAALLQAAEEDARSRGAKGIAAWGLRLPIWMKASWFRKHGYRIADKDGMRALVWKRFTDDARPPKWIKKVKTPESADGKVSITAFRSGWCPAMNIAFERAKRAAALEEFAGVVDFKEIDTSGRDKLLEWGIGDAVYMDGREIRNGPPPPYGKVVKRIRKRVGKLH